MIQITSPSNPRISKLQALHTTRGRKKQGLFLMEGPHLITALLEQNILPHELYYQPVLLQRTHDGQQLLQRILHHYEHNRLIEVSERVIEAMSDTQTSQGIVAVLPLTAFKIEETRQRRPSMLRPALLVLDGVADPGNMGTILRTALAANVDAVLLTEDCVDYYSPKVIRAAAGAHIALPVESDLAWPTLSQRITAHSEKQVLLAEAGSADLYYEQDLTQPFVLIVGNEAHGPSQQARSLATRTITIPLANGVESLNAAMATGIILYEGVRQLAHSRR